MADDAARAVEVAPDGLRWIVSRGEELLAMYETRSEALEEGRRLAAESGLALIVRDMQETTAILDEGTSESLL